MGSSTWAEIYGVRYLGGIKALTTSLMVFSTAFGTALFGVLIDSGFCFRPNNDDLYKLYCFIIIFIIFGIEAQLNQNT